MAHHITIGTDPEIILTDAKGKLLNASNYLIKEDKFGLDGHAWIAELRPDYAVYPRDLVENIRKVLSTKADALKHLMWLSGPWLKNKPMGGHIHFGVPLEQKFVDALDNQLGFLLALSEPEEGAKLRRTQKFQGSHDDHPYGVLSNVREKKKTYGGFEYRTPGSYLASPGIALATITVAKAIIVEEIEKGKMAWSQLKSSMREDLKVNREDFENCNRPVFQNKLDAYWNVLRGMRFFQKGMEGHDLWPVVSYFKSKVFPLNGFRVGHDIKTQWGFPSTVTQPRKRRVIPKPYPTFWGDSFRLIKGVTNVPLNFKMLEISPAELTWEFITTLLEGE